MGTERSSRGTVVIGFYDGRADLLPEGDAFRRIRLTWGPADFGLPEEMQPDPYWMLHHIAHSHAAADPARVRHAEFPSVSIIRNRAVGQVLEMAQARQEQAMMDRALGGDEFAVDSRLHLIVPTSHTLGHPTLSLARDLVALAEAHDLPVVLHAVLDDREGYEQSAASIALQFTEMFTSEKVQLGCVVGAHHILDPDVTWERALETYRALVVGPAESIHSLPMLIRAWQETGKRWADLPAVRIGDYEGMLGQVVGTRDPAHPFPDNFLWRGEETALFLDPRPHRLSTLLRLVQRVDLPPEIEPQSRYRQRFRAIGFEPRAVATVVPQLPEVESCFPYEPQSSPLGQALESGAMQALFLAHLQRSKPLFAALRGRALREGELEEHVGILDDLGDAVGSLDGFVERVLGAIEQRTDLVVLGFGEDSFETHQERGSGDRGSAKKRLEGTLERVARAVEQTDGTLLLVPIAAPPGDADVLTWHKGRAAAQELRLTEIVPTVLAALSGASTAASTAPSPEAAPSEPGDGSGSSL